MDKLANVKLTLVENTRDVEDFKRWLSQSRPVLGADLETTGLHVKRDKIRLAQFGDASHGWAFPYRDWRGVVAEVFREYEGKFVWHHAKYDAGMLAEDGIAIPWDRTHDTLPMCFLDNSLGPKKLKTAAKLHVDPAAAMGEKELKAAMSKNKWTWATVPLTRDFPLYWAYGALDPVLTVGVADVLWPRIQPYREAYDLEMACSRILTDMERRGARIDVDYCARQRQDLSWQLDTLREKLAPLNPLANEQVIAAFQAQGVELKKRTKDGRLSVDEEVLLKIGSPLAMDVLEARRLQRLISAYFDNFLEQREGDILHPHINQLEARTGRMSVTEPALQQVPKNSLVRDAFIPREGNRLILCDYDNEEVRLMAHYSPDPGMTLAFAEGRDLHMETAIACYGPQEGPKHRSKGKRGMFSKAYGAGIAKFALTIGVNEAEAKRIFDALARTWPGIDRGMEKATRAVRERAAAEGKDTGYVTMRDGRRIRVKKDKAYVGWNALIQGNGAVVLKRGIVDCEAAGLGEYLILPVHDELYADAPAADAEDVAHTMEETMRRDDWRVPLTATATIADRWGDPTRGKE